MPTITFQVNLTTARHLSDKGPYTSPGDYANFSNSRTTWFPDGLLRNRELKHGDEFTLSGSEALYMKNNYTSGDYKFLDIVTEVAS